MNSDFRAKLGKALLASGATILSLTAGAAQAEPVKVADDLTQADARLASIGYRLAQASANRCEQPEMMTGLTFHDIAGYDADARPLVVRAHGLTQGFGIQAMLPEGAGARAGLRAGDEVVAVNGTDLQGFGTDLITRRASYRRVEAFIALLGTALRAGPATVTIRREGKLMDLSLSGDAGCGGQFTVQPGRAFNAWSDGHYVAVTSRMMNDIPDDDELAFVVAHEMAHNILRHREMLAGRSGFFAELGFGAGKVKATEVAADQLAVHLIAGAGFDRAAPERFLRRSAAFRFGDLAITHPGLGTRIRLVETELASLGPVAPTAPALAVAPVWGQMQQAVFAQWGSASVSPLAGASLAFGARDAVLAGIARPLPVAAPVQVAAAAPRSVGGVAAASLAMGLWRVDLSELGLRTRLSLGSASAFRCDIGSPMRMADAILKQDPVLAGLDESGMRPLASLSVAPSIVVTWKGTVQPMAALTMPDGGYSWPIADIARS